MSEKRPTEKQRQKVADDIMAGGPSLGEVIKEEIGISGKSDILDEAQKERDEGGGPVADAVDAVEAQLDGGGDAGLAASALIGDEDDIDDAEGDDVVEALVETEDD